MDFINRDQGALTRISFSLARYIYIYIYIYDIHFELRFFDFGFHIESCPQWDSNPRPCAYCAHALTTELSGQTMRFA